MTQVQIVLAGRRITIPVQLAKQFDIKEGDIVVMEACNDGILITPAKVIPRNETREHYQK